jgi:ribonuclease BN (tRNA processing enzyme)
MARYGLPWLSLTHQVITHFHIDHCAELPSLLFSFKHGHAEKRTARLELVGPRGLRALIESLAAAFKWRILEQEFPVDIVEIEPDASRELGGGAILRTAKTPHTVESLAVRIDHAGRSIAYTGDTSPSDALAGFFRGVDVLVAECSFLEDVKATPHLAADDVSKLAREARVKHLVATHCYFDPDKDGLAARLARGFDGRITVATDGLSVEA